jgi:2-polyprenyl-3-methyl-5-hydroxy-6-metoxy-1,4-benzoquinol methylase/uncharacterized protein YbaR (Trm112 family)
MHRELTRWLVCPKCGGSLTLRTTQETAEINEGNLVCSGCSASYPIIRGIPRFVEQENYSGSFGYQWNRYARLQLDSYNGTTFSRERFYSITEWRPDELSAKLVLDAGCGAGRFAETALAAGAQVIALDLSSAVEACQANLGGNSRLHCVQASIYALPFPDQQFDYVYSIGVIQHTPDPKRSVLSLLKKVKTGGKVGLWIYERTWKSFVGTVGFKYLLRPWTRRWSVTKVEAFSNRVERLCWPLLRWTRNRGAVGKIVMRLLPASSAHLQGLPLTEEQFREWVRLDTFDMYSPAYDHPQTFPRVKSWLQEGGFQADPRHPHGAVSITGTRLR